MRKSISTAFFSMVSTLMVLGIVLMGCSEWVLFKNYFAKDRYETLDQVVSVAKRTAEYLVNSETMPQGAELDALNTKLEIIGESAEAYLFFTDRQGNVLIASDPAKLTTGTVPLDICQRANAVADPDARHYHAFGDLGGALTEKSYIAAVETIDDQSLFSGWLFLCSSGAQLTDFNERIIFQFTAFRFLTDSRKIIPAVRQHRTTHHSHVPVVPSLLIHSRRSIRDPYLSVSAVGQRRHIFHDTGNAVRRMVEKKLAPHGIRRAEKAAHHTLRKYSHRLTCIECCFIIRLSIDKGEVKYAPKDVVRLSQVHTDRRTARQRYRSGYRKNSINSNGFRCLQRLETFAGSLCAHRSVTCAVSPI